MNSKARWGALLLCAVLLLVGIFTGFHVVGQGKAEAHAVAGYPTAWVAENMPCLPGAAVEPGKNIENGVQFTLHSHASLNAVREFFEEAFAEQSWDFKADEKTTEFAYFNEFRQGDKRVTVNIMPDPKDMSQSKIRVTFQDDSAIVQPVRYTVTTAQ